MCKNTHSTVNEFKDWRIGIPSVTGTEGIPISLLLCIVSRSMPGGCATSRTPPLQEPVGIPTVDNPYAQLNAVVEWLHSIDTHDIAHDIVYRYYG